MKYTVIGATGQTGSVVARSLKSQGHEVRVVVRDPSKIAEQTALGYEVAVAAVDDIAQLTHAFTRVDGVYLMNPPAYFDQDMFARAHTVHAALLTAMQQAAVPHGVALSSVGAQHATGTGNIETTYDFEQQIHASGLNISVLRAANFLDNWSSAIPSAQEQGILPSMFVPLDKAWPMVSSIDIGEAAATLLIMGAEAPKLVELHGPQAYSPNQVAAVLSQLLGKTVKAVEVPTATIAPYFESLGFPALTAQAFQNMMQGFNTDHIVFTEEGQRWTGKVDLLRAMQVFTG